MTSPGRLEVVRTSPTIIVDAAHNPHGAAGDRATVSEAFAFQPLIGVLGCMKDKDVYGLLEAYEPIMETVDLHPEQLRRAVDAGRGAGRAGGRDLR